MLFIKKYPIVSLFCISVFFIILIFLQNNRYELCHKSTELLNKNLIKKATSITVKVNLENTFGSGILINKKHNYYTVITNRHVISRGKKYYIQTPDGNVYQGKLIEIVKNNDLAILEFVSKRNYTIATFNNLSMQLGEHLFATGFPFSSQKLHISSGKLLLLTEKPLRDGYQVGYTNEIQKGMSGGAILNSLGEVVGVNGRSANPIIPDYQFQDGTYPDDSLQKRMVLLSWGIPIKNIKILK